MTFPDAVLLATTNRGKASEWTEILAAHGVTAVVRGVAPIPEDGTTYAENAEIKARAAASSHGMCALGDDVGIEVAALDGAPGLHTRRWAESRGGFEAACQWMSRVAGGSAATFHCGVALAWPDGRVVVATGVVAGRIAVEVGSAGAGFEPCFVPDGHSLALSDLDEAARAVAHHRLVAFRTLQSRSF